MQCNSQKCLLAVVLYQVMCLDKEKKMKRKIDNICLDKNIIHFLDKTSR